MTEDRQKPVWAWIVALLIGLPVLYVASFGPACWLIHKLKVTGDPKKTAVHWIGLAYSPCGEFVRRTDDGFVGKSLIWYAGLGIPKGEELLIPTGWRSWLQPKH